MFDLRPYYIEKKLKLRQPMYSETSSYGHMGRVPTVVKKRFTDKFGKSIEKNVEIFTWEKLDYVDKLKQEFKLLWM